MTFQNAGGLLWLVPLGGAIIFLYLLRMRRRDFRVPASFLWPQMTDEVRANALIQRLRFSWLLVLQLLALSLVVFAVARPQTKQRGLAGEVTVLVVDASASMGATDVTPSRFEAAKQLAIDAVKSAKPGDRIALIEAGPTPRVIFPLSNDPTKEITALSELRRYDSECDMGEALRLAAALVGSQEGARIVLISDGCFDPIENFSRGKAAVVYQQVGRSAANLAVSALGTAETPGGRRLYVGVRNFGLDASDATVTLYGDGQPIDSEKATIGGGSTWGKTIIVAPNTKVFEARIAGSRDYLAADNYAVTLVDPGSSLHVLLVGAGDPFLERALVLDPRVTLDKSPAVPSDTAAYDIAVFDGVQESEVKSRGVLTFGAAGSSSPVNVLGTIKDPVFVSSESSPLMESVDLNGTYIETAERVRPKATAKVLATANAGPLIVSDRSSTGARHVYVAFSPLHSDFPLQVAFPIFVGNCLDYLAGEESASMLAVRAGSPFAINTSRPVIVQSPGRQDDQVPAIGGTAVVRTIREVGPYTISVDEKKKPLYAYLRSDRESNIAPGKDIVLGGGQVKAQQAPVRFTDFWKPLILLCLLVLSGEWWLYARRS